MKDFALEITEFSDFLNADAKSTMDFTARGCALQVCKHSNRVGNNLVQFNSSSPQSAARSITTAHAPCALRIIHFQLPNQASAGNMPFSTPSIATTTQLPQVPPEQASLLVGLPEAKVSITRYHRPPSTLADSQPPHNTYTPRTSSPRLPPAPPTPQNHKTPPTK
jgi:hypothetical protein